MGDFGKYFFSYFDSSLDRGEVIGSINSEGFLYRTDLLDVIFWPLNARRLPTNADIDIAHPFFESGVCLNIPSEVRWCLSEYVEDWAGLSVLSRLYLSFLFFHCELQWVFSSEGVLPNDGDLRSESLPVLTRLVLGLNDASFQDFFRRYLDASKCGLSDKNLSLSGSLDLALQLLRGPMRIPLDRVWIESVGHGMDPEWTEAWCVAFV